MRGYNQSAIIAKIISEITKIKYDSKILVKIKDTANQSGLTKNLRDDVMTSTADGYATFKWANELLNEDDKVLSIHRSIFFATFKVVPGDFISWSLFNKEEENKVIKNIILKEKPTYILYTEGNEILFKSCLGDIIHKGEKIG